MERDDEDRGPSGNDFHGIRALDHEDELACDGCVPECVSSEHPSRQGVRTCVLSIRDPHTNDALEGICRRELLLDCAATTAWPWRWMDGHDLRQRSSQPARLCLGSGGVPALHRSWPPSSLPTNHLGNRPLIGRQPDIETGTTKWRRRSCGRWDYQESAAAADDVTPAGHDFSRSKHHRDMEGLLPCHRQPVE